MIETCLLRVKVSPRASKNSVTVLEQGTVKVSVTEAPVDGGANKAVCELVAKRLGVRKGAVSVVKGHTSRDKTLLIEGMGLETVARLLRGND